MQIKSIALAFILAAPMAQAQDFYGGVALDYHLPHSGDGHAAATGIIGVDTMGDLFTVLGELEFGKAITDAGDYDATRIRMIGVLGTARIAPFASLGATNYAVGSDNVQGYNFGIGAQYSLSRDATVRVEWLRDRIEDYPTDVTITRLALIYRF